MKLAARVCTFVIAVLVSNACGGTPEDASTDQGESAVGTCGTMPRAPVCMKLTCDADGTWEPSPLPAGTACNTTGHCDGEGTCVTTPPPVYPISPPPSNLTATPVNADEILLQFTCGANATAHQIYRNINGGPFGAYFGPSTSCPAGSLIEQDNYITPGSRYCYYVVGYNSQYQAQTSTVCATAPLDTTVPALPTGSTAAAIDGGDLTFHDNATNEDGYRVYLAKGTDPWGAPIKTFSNPNPALGHKDETYGLPGTDFKVHTDGLTPGVTYYYKVEVYHDNAPESAAVIFPAFKPRWPLPTPPTNFQVTAVTDTSISVTFSPGTSVDHYQVTAVPAAGSSDGLTLPASATSVTFSGLQVAMSYCISGVSYNADNYVSNVSPKVCTSTTGTKPRVSYSENLIMTPYPPYEGEVVNAVAIPAVSQGNLDTFVVPGWPTNDARLTGFIFVSPSSGSAGQVTCDNGIFVQVGNALTSAQMQTLYGDAHASMANPLPLLGCATWTVPPQNLLSVLMTVKYTAPRSP